MVQPGYLVPFAEITVEFKPCDRGDGLGHPEAAAEAEGGNKENDFFHSSFLLIRAAVVWWPTVLRFELNCLISPSKLPE